MKKITSLGKLEELLSQRLVYISTPPLLERLFKKIPTNSKIIVAPNEFNSLSEFESYVSDIRNKDKGIIIGRGYVIDLIRGKVKLGKPSTRLRGNVLVLDYKRAIKILDKYNVKNKSKVLEYSSLPFDNCTSYIPVLLREAIRLEREGKLDEQVKVVNRFKLLLYKTPSAKEPIEALKGSYRGLNLREDWERLSTFWREVIYYYLDSSLGLLPGESKRRLSDIPNYSSPSLVDLDLIEFPEYIDLVDLGLRNALNGKSVYVVGNLRSGKTTLSSIINKRAKQLGFDLEVVDYHDSEGFKYIERIAREIGTKSNVVAVLTNDLYRVLSIKGGLILKPGNRVISALAERKNLALKFDNSSSDTPLSFLLTSNGTPYDDYFFEYMFNVIFDADPNKVLWYLPLLKIAKDYGVPIPEKLGYLALESYGRKVDLEKDLVIKWFSTIKNEIKFKIGLEYGTDLIDTVEIPKIKNKLKEVITSRLTPQLAKSLIELYYYSLVNLTFAELPDLGDLKDYLVSRKRVNKLIKEVLEELMPVLLENTAGEVEKTCLSLKTRLSVFRDKVNSGEVDEVIEDALLAPYKLLSDIKIILSNENSPQDCVESAVQIAVSASKGGRTDWIKSIIPDLVKRARENKLFSHLFSVVSFYYLMDEDDEQVEEVLRQLNDEYAIFPLSIVKYKKGGLESLEIRDPLKATLVYGILADYALSNKDVVKLALLYEKFRRNAVRVKEVEISKEEALILSDFLMTIPTSNVAVIYKYLASLKRRLDAGIGYTLLLTHPKSESVKTTIELVEKLSNDWFNEVMSNVKKGEYVDEDCMDLLKMYQLRIMKSIAKGEKYEYKTILRDAMELRGLCSQVKSSDIKGAIDIVCNLANVILYNNLEETIISGTSIDLAIYLGSLILLGYDNKQPFFNVIAKQVVEKNPLDSLERLLVELINASIYGDRKSLDEIVSRIRDNYYTAMAEVLMKVVWDKKRLVLGLIPFIGMWHITGSRPRLVM
ncbi:hypothetical protein KN1_03710 [Stygiolobus caldivivus]|uniref:Uncharacterized protein n=2 Tax=Stygiolobus caldivivus TaxID=2824673 RepID=A0A8D5ZGR9_9CREN|nr:hypothetical protein KN1_03710 [Stygiolobus caldivivus]